MRTGDSGRAMRHLALLALVMTLLIAGAAPAFAAPVDEYLGLSDLQVLLDNAPGGAPVDGYLKTVLRGSTIATIPVEVIATTSDSLGASNATKALIIFEAKGPVIDRLHGIASGMSGSPIYVKHEGTDKVIGALSYGDADSANGVGFATPVEAMLRVADYPTSPLLTMSALDSPVVTSAGLIKNVVITSDPAIAAAAHSTFTFVAKPYSVLSIGSLAPASQGYKALAALATHNGYDLHPRSGDIGPSKSSFTATITPGSGIAALVSWGDFWVGSIGTVTCVDSDTVLAFGHPMSWLGASQYAMANAWIDDTIGNGEAPYKLGRPGMVRGTVTQDRGAAILGRSGLRSMVTTITSTVTESSTGNKATATTFMPRALVTGDWSALPGLAVYDTALRTCDDYAYAGSARTTTTIVVSDGATTYTIVRPNVWNDEGSVAFGMVGDPLEMVSAFEAAEGAQVLSVDFQAALDPAYVDARIVDVATPDGLRANATNTVRVSLLARGNPATQTVDVKLAIPADSPAVGSIMVSGGGGSTDEETSSEADENRVEEVYPPAPQTTSEVANALQEEPRNSDLIVSFSPIDPKGNKRYQTIEAIASTPWYLTGSTAKRTALFSLSLDETTIAYKGLALLRGEVEGIYTDSTLSIYGRSVDATTSRLLGSVTVQPDEDALSKFEKVLIGLKKNTVLTVRFNGDQDTLCTEASKTVKVRAAVKLTPSATRVRYGKKVKLTAALAPSTTVGKVVFERYRSGRWRSLATKRLSRGKAAVTFTPARGTTKVRVRYLGGIANAAKTSSTKMISAR